MCGIEIIFLKNVFFTKIYREQHAFCYISLVDEDMHIILSILLNHEKGPKYDLMAVRILEMGSENEMKQIQKFRNKFSFAKLFTFSFQSNRLCRNRRIFKASKYHKTRLCSMKYLKYGFKIFCKETQFSI